MDKIQKDKTDQLSFDFDRPLNVELKQDRLNIIDFKKIKERKESIKEAELNRRIIDRMKDQM